MRIVAELLQRAERYRQLKRRITDERAIKALDEIAHESEMTAAEIERRCRIRARAEAIWAAYGRPEGRDVEFWLAAEREIDGEQAQRRLTSAVRTIQS